MAILNRDAEKDRKVRVLVELGDYHWRKFDGRRTQEWKVNFALWAALAALVGILTWKGITVPEILAYPTIGFLIVIVWVYWIKWQTGMWRRNHEDTESAREAFDRVRAIVGEPMRREFKFYSEPTPCGNLRDHFGVLCTWSRGSQIIFTLGFAMIAALTVWCRIAPVIDTQQSPPITFNQTSPVPPQIQPIPICIDQI